MVERSSSLVFSCSSTSFCSDGDSSERAKGGREQRERGGTVRGGEKEGEGDREEGEERKERRKTRGGGELGKGRVERCWERLTRGGRVGEEEREEGEK